MSLFSSRLRLRQGAGCRHRNKNSEHLLKILTLQLLGYVSSWCWASWPYSCEGRQVVEYHIASCTVRHLSGSQSTRVPNVRKWYTYDCLPLLSFFGCICGNFGAWTLTVPTKLQLYKQNCGCDFELNCTRWRDCTDLIKIEYIYSWTISNQYEGAELMVALSSHNNCPRINWLFRMATVLWFLLAAK